MDQNTLKNMITIIIVLYREDYEILYKTLDKIRDFKKIIIDNSNNLKLKNKLEANFKIEKYILNKKNIGFSAGYNQGVKLCETDFFLILNPDCIIDYESIIKLHEKLVVNEDCFLTTPTSYDENNKLTYSGGLLPENGDIDFPIKIEGDICVENTLGACIFLRKKDFIEIGLFDFFNSDKGNQFENQYAHPSKRTPKKIKGHGYSDFYQKYFENLKSNNLNILEIGSFHGNASAALFFYFKNSKIFAADIYPDLFRYKSNRIESFYVNSADENSIQNNIIDKFSNNFDIIIEDAGHFFKDQIISLFMLFKKLNKGGFFIIEELDFPDTRQDMNLQNEKPTLREILLKFKNEKILLNSKYIKKNDRDNFLDNIDSIEIYKGNFNEIAILKKK